MYERWYLFEGKYTPSMVKREYEGEWCIEVHVTKEMEETKNLHCMYGTTCHKKWSAVSPDTRHGLFELAPFPARHFHVKRRYQPDRGSVYANWGILHISHTNK